MLWSQIVGASISGTVRDGSGASLSGAAVSVRNMRDRCRTQAGQRRSREVLGAFHSCGQVPGFRFQGRLRFADEDRDRLGGGSDYRGRPAIAGGRFEANGDSRGNPEPGSVSTQQISGLVSERQVKDLPLNGRSYDQLITLNPGVVNYTAERSGGVGTSNSSVGNMFAVSGRRPQENLFLLNGMEYTGASVINITPGGASGQLLGVDAVREFNVVSDTYGAEYGKRPGGTGQHRDRGGHERVSTGRSTNSSATATWTRAISSTRAAIPQFQRNSFGGSPGRADQEGQDCFYSAITKAIRQHLGVSDVTLVPDNDARKHRAEGKHRGRAGGCAAASPLAGTKRPLVGQRYRRSLQPPVADDSRRLRNPARRP